MMKNKFLAFLTSSILVFSFSVLKADINVGASFMLGQVETSGTETEKTDIAAGDDKNSKTLKETFIGGSVFIEAVADNGFAIGVDYVPIDTDLGDGKRTDTTTGTGSVGGNRKASASLEDLFTVYANVPLGSNGYYGLAGYHTVDVTTSETLPNSSYGDADLNGYQVGLGKKGDNFKIEAFYSDFEDIKLTSTGGSAAHVIEADADAFGLKLSFFY